MGSDPYSRHTFEEFAKVRHYVSVRLKQGVPLVDADVNEMEDLRRYELRSFCRWFVGNGVPAHNDGFRILPCPAANDVTIAGGDGTPEGAGRCLVDGLEVLNESDVPFSEQEFAIPANAGAAGVDPVTMPETPVSGERIDIYYLDVWEREIGGDEPGHADIVDSRIGIETSRRIRREWAVRVVGETTGVPADDTPPGHRYYPLASVLRCEGEDVIPAGAITDLRRCGVTLQSSVNIDQIVVDAFGGDYTLNVDGHPALTASLCDVMNAMLRAGRPAVLLAAVVLAADGPHTFPAGAVDTDGNLWLFWLRGEAANEIWHQRQHDGRTWAPPGLWHELNGGSPGIAVAASLEGAMWLFWSDMVNPTQWDIFGRVFHDGVWGEEFTVSEGAPNVYNLALSAGADREGQVMVVWKRQDNLGNVSFRSRMYAGSPAAARPAVDVSDEFETAPVVVVGRDDTIHTYGADAAAAPARILHSTWQPAAANWSAPAEVGTIDAGPVEMAAVADRFGGTWLLYADGHASLTGRYLRAGFSSDPTVLGEAPGVPRFLSATRDARGNVRVYFVPASAATEPTRVYQITLVSKV